MTHASDSMVTSTTTFLQTFRVVIACMYLHANHIEHRDLKPENVLVSNKHYTVTPCSDVAFYWTHRPICVKLSDFGESRSAMGQTQTQSVGCTSVISCHCYGNTNETQRTV